METRVDSVAKIEFERLLQESQELKGGLGAVSWAVLEMCRRGGMDAASVEQLYAMMGHYFARPSNDDCNAVLKVVEARLKQDYDPGKSAWY